MDIWGNKITTVNRYDVIVHCVNNFTWQKYRLHVLKGKDTKEKLDLLQAWLTENKNSHAAQCQVDNYLGALKRGGQIDASGKVVK